MRIRRQILLFLFFWVIQPSSSSAKVLVRWTQPTIPNARSLGVSELVISPDTSSTPFVKAARHEGYKLFIEATPEQATELSRTAARKGITGFIIKVDEAQRTDFDDQLRKLRAANPKLTFRVLNPHGKQPQIRGRMVVERNGILQVSSPSSQPWVDSNQAVVRFEQAFYPAETPVYTFQWELTDTLQRQLGPSAANYSLAIAEAGALHSDIILNIHEPLQVGLAKGDSASWALWNQVKRYLVFSAYHQGHSYRPLAYVGVVTDSFVKSYEAVNLLARHNIPFRIIRHTDLKSASMNDLDIAILFHAPERDSLATVHEFTARGGIVVLVNIKGSFPWQSAPQEKVGEDSISYADGKGRVIEFAGPVLDPETFAVDIRRLMGTHKTMVSLWNSLTTIVVPYRDASSGKTTLELINYAEESLEVQLQMKGAYQTVRYSTPELGCCQAIVPVEHDGFTDLLAHKLIIAGRAELEPIPADHPKK